MAILGGWAVFFERGNPLQSDFVYTTYPSFISNSHQNGYTHICLIRPNYSNSVVVVELDT